MSPEEKEYQGYLESCLQMSSSLLKIRDKRIEDLEAVIKTRRPFTDTIDDLKSRLDLSAKSGQISDAKLLIATCALRHIYNAGLIGLPNEGKVFYESPECKIAAKALNEIRNYKENLL